MGPAAELIALAPTVVDTGPALTGPDVVFILAAGSFIACGLVAWHRRPDNHSGRLMTATGFVALLKFVTGGRLESRVDRLLVGVFALTLRALQLVWMLFPRARGQPRRGRRGHTDRRGDR